MISVDLRSRTAADVRAVTATDFFGHELPQLIADRGGLAAPGARELHLRPFAIDVGGQVWTLSFDGSQFTVADGEDGAPAAVRLDADGLDDIVNDIRTPMAFFSAGDLDMPRGGLDAFLDWWVVLRSLLDGQPVHTSGSVRFHGRDGEPLALDRSFGPDDDLEEASHFLGEAGYLHLTGVFTPDEMAAVSSEMDAAMPSYYDGDGRSWWATTRDGERRLVRMQYFHEQSAATRALLDDSRLKRLCTITSDGHSLHKPGGNENIIEALVKPIGVVEGISDVPWHKDCSLGSHSYRCCSMTVGISVTGADAESGQLRVVAGSHRALIQPAFVRRTLDLPQIDLPTQTGDVTIHLSCTLHMAQPPTSRERRVMYTDFNLPAAERGPDPGEAKLKRVREAAPTTVSQPDH